jgi:bifunctional non-homologous end joining protein LigD
VDAARAGEAAAVAAALPGRRRGTCFFQKHWTPAWASAEALRLREKEGEDEYPYATDAASLLQLVQMNTLEFHTWGARVDAPEKPDRLVFDLDPDAGMRMGARSSRRRA